VDNDAASFLVAMPVKQVKILLTAPRKELLTII
jgi:hypothetical protein